jgi:hypothetical protein
LAPLAPLGGGRSGGGGQWGTRSSGLADDESHDSVSEEDARKVAALDAQIAHLTNKSAGGGGGGGSTRSADRSADDYDDSFVEQEATPAEQSLEEEIEYASDDEEAF